MPFKDHLKYRFQLIGNITLDKQGFNSVSIRNLVKQIIKTNDLKLIFKWA